MGGWDGAVFGGRGSWGDVFGQVRGPDGRGGTDFKGRYTSTDVVSVRLAGTVCTDHVSWDTCGLSLSATSENQIAGMKPFFFRKQYMDRIVFVVGEVRDRIRFAIVIATTSAVSSTSWTVGTRFALLRGTSPCGGGIDFWRKGMKFSGCACACKLPVPCALKR